MGIKILLSSSSYDSEGKKTAQDNRVEKNPNPNPERYSVKRIYTKGDYMVIKVNYPDCTNYEGNKILVFKGCTMVDLAQQGSIDPHFSENIDFHSPIARFKPDEEGWKMAEFFVDNFI